MSLGAIRNDSNTPTLYFAYGSNLSTTQMRQRCPSSTYIGVGLLVDWHWIINEKGYANIVSRNPESERAEICRSLSFLEESQDPMDYVYGLVYALEVSDESLLDGYEGVPWAYTKETVRIALWDGGTAVGEREGRLVDALVYVDRLRTKGGRIKDEYVLRMSRAVREAATKGLPAQWMETVIRPFLPVA
ncbi:hypothetical protein MMC19_005582 [Ptychographa xylographoides]|nr:hypothetical protein [Ptychographa xylographoides]